MACSWDEHGKYDVPAQMDLITRVTGKQDMFYIGHSMGTTMFFVMNNERPEYRERIKAMFALAPIARVDHMLSPIYLIAPFVDEVSVRLRRTF
jgi:lysosomal acid lipase/cholesteryl ester hydrolase